LYFDGNGVPKDAETGFILQIKVARDGSEGAMEHVKEYKLNEKLREEGVRIRNDE